MNQKRFSAAFEIEVEILKKKKQAKSKLVTAEAIEAKVKELLHQSNSPSITCGEKQYFVEQADFERKKANKIRRSVELIYENRIPQLSRTLAAFNTQPMAFIEDAAVVLQK